MRTFPNHWNYLVRLPYELLDVTQSALLAEEPELRKGGKESFQKTPMSLVHLHLYGEPGNSLITERMAIRFANRLSFIVHDVAKSQEHQ